MFKRYFITAPVMAWAALSLTMFLPIATAQAQSPDATVVLGDARISNCGFGQREGANKQCINEVFFHALPGLPENEIARLTGENGWRLASPEEVTLAWEQLGLNQPSFGKLANGTFAAPAQADNGPALKRGVNLRDAGVAMFATGFFYVDARTTAPAAPEQPAPTPAPAPVAAAPQASNTGCPNGQRAVERNGNMVCEGTINIASGPPAPAIVIKDGDPRPQQGFLDQAADLCADPGNFMFDGWNTAERAILEEAGHEIILKKGLGYATSDMSHVVAKLKADPVLRWEFAPLMIESAWEALTTATPTPAQAAFKDRFEKWAGCDNNRVARMTLTGWNFHVGKDSSGTSIDGIGIEWIDPNPQYETATWSLAAKKGPSLYGFDVTNNGNPLFIGHKGRVALSTILAPMSARDTPDVDDITDVKYVKEDFSGVAIAAGVGGGGVFAATLATAVGAVPLYNAVMAQKFQSIADAGVQAFDKAKDPAARAAAEEAAKKGFRANKDVLKKAFQKVFTKTSNKIASKAATKAATQVGVKVGVQAGTKLAGSTIGFAAIIAVAAATFGEELAEIIQTKLYEDGLTYDAQNVTPYSVAEALGPNPSAAEKAPVFSLLLKMLISKPADRNRLSLELPLLDCPIGFSAAGDQCVIDVEFYNEPSLTLDQVKLIADRNGWTLASPEMIKAAWTAKRLDRYAFGMMSDGKFAVPVQRDYSNFKKGHNIGAVGGNQGFFYVMNFVDNSQAAPGGTFIQNAKTMTTFFPATDKNDFNRMDKPGATWKLVGEAEFFRIQNVKAPNTYAYVDKGKLAFGPAGQHGAAGQWKVEKSADSFVRIQSVALPYRYIHYEKGALDLSYIEANWKGALWHIPETR